MKPILITGTQRSGTSMIAGCLFYLGVYMGNNFLKKDIHNPTGYFEDVEFGELDENRWRGAITEYEWKKRIKNLIKLRNDNEVYGFTRWGWKNPSSGLFILDYIELCNPVIIWCKRKDEDIKKSMRKMYWKDETADKAIKNKYESMNRLKKEQYIEVFMEDMLDNPELEIGKLIGHLDLKPTKTKVNKALNHIIRKPNKQKLETETYLNYV